jgi:hypothetical protein
VNQLNINNIEYSVKKITVQQKIPLELFRDPLHARQGGGAMPKKTSWAFVLAIRAQGIANVCPGQGMQRGRVEMLRFPASKGGVWVEEARSGRERPVAIIRARS